MQINKTNDRFKRYRQSVKGKVSLKRRTKKYLSTEKGKATKEQWKINNREKINEYGRKQYQKDISLTLFNIAKYRAKKKGIAFSITKEDIIVPDVCPILGIVLKKGDKKFKDHSPSLDKIKSAKGYVKGNVQVISFRANMLKNNATIEELEKIISFLKNIN